MEHVEKSKVLRKTYNDDNVLIWSRDTAEGGESLFFFFILLRCGDFMDTHLVLLLLRAWTGLWDAAVPLFCRKARENKSESMQGFVKMIYGHRRIKKSTGVNELRGLLENIAVVNLFWGRFSLREHLLWNAKRIQQCQKLKKKQTILHTLLFLYLKFSTGYIKYQQS